MTLKPLSYYTALVALVALGCCTGSVEPGQDTDLQSRYGACTDYHTCCPPDALRCEGDVDEGSTCTCSQLWSCHSYSGNPEKCEALRPVPPASGIWTCTWSKQSYRCTRGGPEAPLPGGGQGQWTCHNLDGEMGWECNTLPPNPANQPGGENLWSCTVDNGGDKILCTRIASQSRPPDVPQCSQEICNNGKDDDCDGKQDCADSDCANAAGCAPKCGSFPVTTCSIPDCNSHKGDDEAACLAAGNSGGCTPKQLKAWCRRRVDPEPNNLWYQIHKKWVDDRCDGQVAFSDVDGKGVFTCVDQGACKEFKCVTPLVLVFERGTGVTCLTHWDRPGGRAFDLSGAQDGAGVLTDWPTAATPWLALDLDGDGQIGSGRELFGTATLVDGRPASHGFEALAALDADKNGTLDARDPAYSRLVLWSDRDGDRVSQPWELTGLKHAGVISLSLRFKQQLRCDERGNCEMERSRFVWRGSDGRSREGEVVDLHLAVRPR